MLIEHATHAPLGPSNQQAPLGASSNPASGRSLCDDALASDDSRRGAREWRFTDAMRKHLKRTPNRESLPLGPSLMKVLEEDYARHEALYSATVQALRQHDWEAAEQEILPYVSAALSEEPAAAFLSCVRQLHILVYIHWRLGPERSFQKVQTLTDQMAKTGISRTVVIGLRNYLDENLIRYGVVLHVIDNDFAVRTCDVHSLLDRFRWTGAKDAGLRDHLYRLLVSALRAVGDFRRAVTHAAAEAEEAETSSDEASGGARRHRTLETALRGAQARLNDSLDRMTQQHGAALSAYLLALVRNEISQRSLALSDQVSRAAGLEAAQGGAPEKSGDGGLEGVLVANMKDVKGLPRTRAHVVSVDAARG